MNNGYQYDGGMSLGALGRQFAHGDEPPSTYAISAWVNGEPYGFARAIGVTTMRTIPIAAGVWGGHKLFGTDSVWGVAGTVSLTLSLMIASSKVWGKLQDGRHATENNLGRFRRRV